MSKRLGIIGGGHVGRELVLAAHAYGVPVAVLAQAADEPALAVCPQQVVGDWADEDVLAAFAALCDVATIENDALDVGVLRRLQALGIEVYPRPETLERAQDKLAQLRTMSNAGLDVARHRKVDVATDLMDAAAEFGFPMLVRARLAGADGRLGVYMQRAADIQSAMERLADAGSLYVEARVPALRELSVTVVRGADGKTLAYPVVEVRRQDGFLSAVHCPAPISEAAAYRATQAALEAIKELEGVGAYGVDLYEIEDDEIVFNDIRCHPTDSGQFTLEGCIASQYENHVRAVMGWALGDVSQIAPAVATVYIIGERNGTPAAQGIGDALSVEGAHIHLYGRTHIRLGRMVGHISVLGYDAAGAEGVARLALSRVKL